MKTLGTVSSVYEKILPPAKDLYSGRALVSSGLSYPDSKDLDLPEDYVLHATRWQNMLENQTTPPYWEEKAVKDPISDKDTYTYPGKTVWESTEGFLRDVDKSAKLQKKGYPVNVKLS